jgi:hypothetical protein
MSRARLSLLSLVAGLSVVGITGVVGICENNFEWKVGGSLLATGQSREYTTSADGKDLIFKGTVGASSFFELLSTELSVEKGANIKGGKPGTNEEIIIFKGAACGDDKDCSAEDRNS